MSNKPNITKLGNGKYNIDWSKVNLDGENEDDFFTYEYNAPKERKCDCGATKVVGYSGFKREHAHWCDLLKDEK